jgi:hypothetical protein
MNKEKLVERCNVNEPCTFLDNRLEGVGFAGKGFVPVKVVRRNDLGRAISVFYGVKYKQARGDDGFMINYCPFCGCAPGLFGEERKHDSNS